MESWNRERSAPIAKCNCLDLAMSQSKIILESGRNKACIYYDFLGDVVARWLVRRTLDLKVESLSPGRCTHIVSLGKTLNSHSASLHPGV